jgi:hypothetical protein
MAYAAGYGFFPQVKKTRNESGRKDGKRAEVFS